MSLSTKEAAQQMATLTKPKFVVNTNHPIMSIIQDLNGTNPDLTKELVRELYDLSLLSQREMDPSTLNTFINRSNTILVQLAKQVTQRGK